MPARDGGLGACMQCMATAMTTGAAVSGTRAWLGTRNFKWLTPVRLKRLTVTLSPSVSSPRHCSSAAREPLPAM